MGGLFPLDCFLILSFVSSLYILEINLLSVVLFASIFSHSVDFFSFVYGFLSCAKAFKFIRSHLFIFVFISITLGNRLPKNSAAIYVNECSAKTLIKLLKIT